jgi:hypothetical protein
MLPATTDVGLRLCDTPVPDSLVTALAPEPACADTANIATMVTDQLFTASRDSVTGEFDKSYLAKCLDVMSRESLTLEHSILEYHYTLYYYDLAGNLVKTVPPEGVKPIRDTATLRQIQVKRAAGGTRTLHGNHLSVQHPQPGGEAADTRRQDQRVLVR